LGDRAGPGLLMGYHMQGKTNHKRKDLVLQVTNPMAQNRTLPGYHAKHHFWPNQGQTII